MRNANEVVGDDVLGPLEPVRASEVENCAFIGDEG